MKETEWVENVARQLREDARLGEQFRIETQMKLPYGYEVREFGPPEHTEVSSFATDLIVIEDLPNQSWKPRIVVEAKVGRITTHDAITYSQKASSHKAVCPYLRYGVMLGNRKHYPLPGRLYRHGQNFDFMCSFKAYSLEQDEFNGFAQLLRDEVVASQNLEKILYQSRMKERDHYTVLHRKLFLGNTIT